MTNIMNVSEFVEKFVEPNTLIRLWYKPTDGSDESYEEVIGDDSTLMEWELIKSEYRNRLMVGVTDILYLKSPYIEAINLVIEREDQQTPPSPPLSRVIREGSTNSCPNCRSTMGRRGLFGPLSCHNKKCPNHISK